MSLTVDKVARNGTGFLATDGKWYNASKNAPASDVDVAGLRPGDTVDLSGFVESGGREYFSKLLKAGPSGGRSTGYATAGAFPVEDNRQTSIVRQVCAKGAVDLAVAGKIEVAGIPALADTLYNWITSPPNSPSSPDHELDQEDLPF